MIATLATVAFATAMTFNFAMRRGRALLALALLYLPGLAVMTMNWQRGSSCVAAARKASPSSCGMFMSTKTMSGFRLFIISSPSRPLYAEAGASA